MGYAEMALIHGDWTFIKSFLTWASSHILLKVFASGTWLFQEFLHEGDHISLNPSRLKSENKQRLTKTLLKRYSKTHLCSSPRLTIETIDSREWKFPQECLLREGKVQDMVLAQERACFTRRNFTQLWKGQGRPGLSKYGSVMSRNTLDGTA